MSQLSVVENENNIQNKKSLMNKEMIIQAVKESFIKLDPRIMIKNPIMFIVEIGFLITLLMSFAPNAFGRSDVEPWFNIVVSIILLFTVLFANFAEAIAEGRGKAQASSLKQSKKEIHANRLLDSGMIEEVPSTQLRKGDIVLVKQGEMIPGDGEVIEGLASVDESAIP